ncbi:unnamed protein product [Musa acuminata subsp. malaccensis]|uniref:(wild Malaysian banana) hypothetical protein n=1 Tax=Musa acuminata subsp. malaccensis TaxID=214687 RepID=A0A8D6ZU34_MUSAM|nr:unnamed protein product [Musa acuminata subsp. malaccensis]
MKAAVPLMASATDYEVAASQQQSDIFLILSLIIVVSSAVFLLRWTRRQGSPPLPPGPVGLPLLGSLLSLEPDLHRYFARLARAYGPVFSLRLGTRLYVVLSSPAAVREALKDHDVIFANRDPAATATAVPGTQHGLLWSPHGTLWRTLRKVTVREFIGGGGCNEAVRSLLRREVRRAIARLRAREGEPVEVWELVFTTALNVMTSMLWGGLSEDGDVSMKFRAVVEGVVELLGAPNVSDLFPVLAALDLQGMGRRMKRIWDRYDVLWKKFVEDSGRRGEEDEGKGGKAFLQVMVEVLERRDQKDPLTMDHVKALFMELILAGTDTTSTTIEWAMAELMRNPDIMRKIQDELDAVVGKERAVEESDVPKLEYLRAVTKETLRLHPVAPLLVPRSPSSPCTVGGYTIPKGSKVFVNVWMIQRDAAIWGEDAVEFRPERFLTAADDKYGFRGTNFAYLPFGSGRRMCAGISLAEKMVTHMLASFLHSFRWQLPEGEKLELGERFGIALTKAEPLVLVPTARFDDPDLYS